MSQVLGSSPPGPNIYCLLSLGLRASVSGGEGVPFLGFGLGVSRVQCQGFGFDSLGFDGL